MDWREVRTDDLIECLEIEPRIWGDEIVGREQALDVWRMLARSLVCNSAVVETGGSRSRRVGFGLSVFVTPQFADRELGKPQPGINSRIVASVVRGKPAVCAEKSLCDAGSPLDVVIMSCNYRYDAMNTEEALQAQLMLPAAFAERHIGYRLNRILVETVSDRQRCVHESSGVWRVVAEYPECERAPAADDPGGGCCHAGLCGGAAV